MPALTVRNIPESTLARLRSRAAREHRSLNGEILAIFEEASDGVPVEGPVWMPPIPLPPKPTFGTKRPDEESISPAERKRRQEKLESLFGSWVDSRSTEEIIADIVGSRTSQTRTRSARSAT